METRQTLWGKKMRTGLGRNEVIRVVVAKLAGRDVTKTSMTCKGIASLIERFFTFDYVLY